MFYKASNVRKRSSREDCCFRIVLCGPKSAHDMCALLLQPSRIAPLAEMMKFHQQFVVLASDCLACLLFLTPVVKNLMRVSSSPDGVSFC